ncbi:hypothetical protein BC826DRAFT_22884 [Russula brevipes]|nr:hypothetical protein BC826DRAFT_22884 [Russula brevipes]
MDSATDTDSDADSSCAEPHSMRARWSPSFGSSPTDKQSSLEEINVALQNLRTLNMRLLVKDVTYANTIGRASIIIVCAIRELATPESWDCDELMDVFKEITSEWFLSKLLAYRREFLPIRVLSASIDGTLVSCVDVMLANISMASVCIASRTTDMDGLEGTLAKQREDEAIRAASQLPHTWAEMLDLLTSNTASFAVLRLSLRLTFAAYTLHPHLSGVKAQTATFAPSWPNNVVRTYLSRISSTESGVHEYHTDEAPSVRSLRDRIAFAMILGLCSTSHSVGETPLEFPYMFPPEVLYLIRAVIDPDLV